MGQYLKGMRRQDTGWIRFLDDVKAGRVEGFSEDDLCCMDPGALESGRISVETFEELRQVLIRSLKNYRTENSSERKRALTSLLIADSGLCRTIGTDKWKNVHNALALRYTATDALTVREVGKIIGKGKEETDFLILEGQRNLVRLAVGFSSVAPEGMPDGYDLTGCILSHYPMLKEAAAADAGPLFQHDQKSLVIRSKELTKSLISATDRALELYAAFSRGDETEERRMEVLRRRFLHGRQKTSETAKEFFTTRTCIQNDFRITEGRIAGILFGWKTEDPEERSERDESHSGR